MDNSQSCGNESENTSKKSPFDNLTQAELIKKCKNLLVIAQKAKQARDACLEENKTLKDDIINFEQQRKSDKECLKTMQEMIESLTEHKLKSITNIDELKKAVKTLESTNDSLTKKNISIEEKLLQFDTENLSLKRQISRLTDDNDKLLQELEVLENRLNNDNSQSDLEISQSELELKLDSLIKENEALKTEKLKLSEEINAITSEVELKTEKTMDSLRNISRDNIGSSKNKLHEELFEETQDPHQNDAGHKKHEINIDLQNLEKLLEKKQEENKALVDEINKYIYENSELNTKLTQLEQSDKQKHTENKVLKDKLKNMSMEFEENNKLIQNLKIELDFQIGKLNAEKDEADSKEKKAQQIADKEKENVNVLKLQINELNTTIKDNNNKMECFETEASELKQSLQAALAKNAKLQDDNNLLLKNIDDLKFQLGESLSSKNLLEEQINKLNIQSKQFDDEQIQEKDEIINNLESNLSNAKTQVTVSEEEIKTVKLNYEQLNQNYNELVKGREKLISKLKMYHQKLTEFASNLKQLKTDKNELLQTMKDYCSTISDWQIKITTISSQLCDKLLEYEKEIKALQDKLSCIESERRNITPEYIESLETLGNENLKLSEELKTVNAEQIEFLKNKLESYEKEKEVLINSNNDLLKKLSILSSDNSQMSEEIKKLLEDKSNLVSNIQTLEEEIVENNLQKTQYNSLKSDNEKLIKELKESRYKCSALEDMETNLNNLRQQLCNKSIENKELLNEMREINEVLKQRGETISNQQEYCGELEKKIISLENEIKNLLFKLNDKDSQLNDSYTQVQRNKQELKDQIQQSDQIKNIIIEKDSLIESLQNEVGKLKDKLNNADAQSDVMSTSTISRAEEASRLKDVESSLEERYTKMKTLACKYKKIVTEKCSQLAALEAENKALLLEKNESTGKVSSNAKNMQILQQECDRLQDEIEEEKKKNKASDKIINSLKDEITKIKSELDSNVENGNKSKSTTESSTKDRRSVEGSNKEQQNLILNLKKNLQEEIEKSKGFEKEIKKLEEIVKSKELQLNEQINNVKSIKDELAESKKEIKKNSVLILEIDNYEKTLNEISKKLELRNGRIKELESAISSNSDTISSLKEQIKLLEANLESEVQHSKEIKDRLNSTQTSLNESEHKNSLQSNEMLQLKHEIEKLTSKIEELGVEFTNVVAEKENIITNCKSEKDSLLRQTYDMENTISNLTENLSKCKDELMDVKTEFSSYKVRAQSILKQNQFKDVSKEDELIEEIKLLTMNNKTLTNDLEQMSKKYDNLNKEHMQVKEEKDKTVEHYNKLIAVVDEVRVRHDLLLEANQTLNIEHQEAIKAQKIQNETLIKCYKQQISELQEQNKKQLEDFRKQFEQLKVSKKSAKDKHTNELKQHEHLFATVQEENEVNISMMERGDGEGSESTNSISPTFITQRKRSITNTRSSRDIIPLDELLNSSITDFNTNESCGDSISPTTELLNIRKNLSMEQLRVKHLTSLLSENEQDLAKLTQLNEVLKEELRKIQRSEEREKHTQNSEYLKNVIFKFVTLNTGDEKSHLVPVLNMLLKLSPEETQKLQDIAKGVDSSAGGRGWGNYLPRWSNNH